jgi:hypothetical protein
MQILLSFNNGKDALQVVRNYRHLTGDSFLLTHALKISKTVMSKVDNYIQQNPDLGFSGLRGAPILCSFFVVPANVQHKYSIIFPKLVSLVLVFYLHL